MHFASTAPAGFRLSPLPTQPRILFSGFVDTDRSHVTQVTGPLLTLAAIFGVLTGGVTVCNILEVRLRETASWPTPAWCSLLLTSTADADMVWGTTAGCPRLTKQCTLVLDDELSTNPDPSVPEDDAAATLCSRNLPDTIRSVVTEIGTLILKLAQESRNTWATASHAGFRPFNSLGFDKALQLWPQMAAGSITRWSRGKWFTPVPLLPEQGLSTKVLMDRVMELWMDAGYGTNDAFLQTYGILPLMPAVGGTPRMLSVLQGRSALYGCDGLPTRYPPELLLHSPALQPNSKRTICDWQRLGPAAWISDRVLPTWFPESTNRPHIRAGVLKISRGTDNVKSGCTHRQSTRKRTCANLLTIVPTVIAAQ